MTKIIKQCLDKGIIKGTKVSIDNTHTEANTIKKVPKRIIKHLAKKIINEVEKTDSEILKKLNTEIPNYKKIEDHNEAKSIMKSYLESLIHDVQSNIDDIKGEKTPLINIIEQSKKILEEPKFIQQKGLRSLIDKKARVGIKTQLQKINDMGIKI